MAHLSTGVAKTGRSSFFMEQVWYLFILGILIVLTLFVILVYVKQLHIIKAFRQDKRGEKESDYDLTPLSLTVDNEVNKLKNQLKSKTFELAKIAKESEDREKLLIKVSEKVDYLKSNPSAFKRVIKELSQLVKPATISSINTFEMQIDELNQELYAKLKERYVELTANDLLLCAYIRAGLDSKEIAGLLNIKPSSVYINRSRLRKKLNITSNEDIFNFLSDI